MASKKIAGSPNYATSRKMEPMCSKIASKSVMHAVFLDPVAGGVRYLHVLRQPSPDGTLRLTRTLTAASLRNL